MIATRKTDPSAPQIVFLASPVYWPDKDKRQSQFRKLLDALDLEAADCHLIDSPETLEQLNHPVDGRIFIAMSGGIQPWMQALSENTRHLGLLNAYLPEVLPPDLSGPLMHANAHPASTDFFAYCRLNAKSIEWLSNQDELRSYIQASAAIAQLRHARFLKIGETEPWVINSCRDPETIREQIGTEVVPVEREALYSIFREVSDEEGLAEADHWLADRPQLLDIATEDVVKACRVTVAMRRLLEEHEADALSMACFAMIGDIDTTSCLALSALNDSASAIGACEGDLDAALNLYLLKALGADFVWIANPIIHSDNTIDLAQDIEADSVFAWWWQLFELQDAWAQTEGLEPLLAHFGTSLVERALIDAFCRDAGRPFHRLLRENAFGIDWALCEPQLEGVDWQQLFPEKPLESAALRHTVGMVDALTEDELSEGNRLADGLPQSLEACIRFYGLSDFKLKLCGDSDQDFARLQAIAAVVQRVCGNNYRFSLDANEQFSAPEGLRAFGQRVHADSLLADFFEHLLLIEQPLSRKVALAEGQTDVRACWPKDVPIIDESDGGWGDLPRALKLGYSGVSHKNCKGIFKGLRNKCLVEQNRAAQPGERPWITSAEDLCNIGPVALLQDLAVQATFGNASIERNGHHYFAGLSMFPETIAAGMLRDHSDLYEADPVNRARLRAEKGKIALGSVNAAPFGVKPHLLPIK